MTEIRDLSDIVSEIIKPGVKLAIGGAAMLMKPMEIIREIIRQGIKDFQVITLIGDLDIDLLSGVGAITEVHSSYIGLPMVGMANNFRRAIEKSKTLKYHEWTELSMVRAYQAGRMGVPFVPVRSLLGSDLVKIRPDFEEITYQERKFVQIPSIQPDIAIVHAYAADPHGNIYYPKYHILDEFSTLPALCAKTLFVTVEKVITEEEGREVSDRVMFSYLDVDYIAETPNGALPSGFPPLYAVDMGHYMAYSGSSRSTEGFQSYLANNVIHKEASL